MPESDLVLVPKIKARKIIWLELHFSQFYLTFFIKT